jgi:poly(3-hydroxyalkanoate) synthetase
MPLLTVLPVVCAGGPGEEGSVPPGGWLADRSGEQTAAPECLGSACFAALEQAPGSYVRQ